MEYSLAKLEEVAGKTWVMPAEFLLGNNDVTEAFKNYARPLLGDMPTVERIAAPTVDQLLKGTTPKKKTATRKPTTKAP